MTLGWLYVCVNCLTVIAVLAAATLTTALYIHSALEAA